MKRTQILIATALLLGLALVLTGCNNSSSSGGGFANVDVQFQVSGNTIIHNANTSRDVTIPTQGTDFRILTWFCGNFEGDQRKQIEITFKKTNNTWVRDSKNVTGGSCS